MIAPRELVQSIEECHVLNLSAQLKGKVLSKITLKNEKEHIGELIMPKGTDYIILRMEENFE